MKTSMSNESEVHLHLQPWWMWIGSNRLDFPYKLFFFCFWDEMRNRKRRNDNNSGIMDQCTMFHGNMLTIECCFGIHQMNAYFTGFYIFHILRNRFLRCLLHFYFLTIIVFIIILFYVFESISHISRLSPPINAS